MEFRWVAALALWTMLSGPILSQPTPPRAAPPMPRLGAGSPVHPVPVVPTSPSPTRR
jgi:hypothetical protein